jgi:hypothetical protein
MTRIPANRICAGTTIVFDGQRIDVRCVEPAIEPNFIWVTNSHPNTPRHARIGIAETVLLEGV